MGKLFGRKKKRGEEQVRAEPKTFFDCIAPATIKFFANYCIVGDTYRCVWVIREYPPSTEEQAILSHLADHSGVTLRMYNRLVEAYEQRQIANNAARKNRLKLDRRGDDKTNSNVLILGNSGQGKSYLMKLLLTNLRESGKRVLVMDAEGEYGDLAVNNGGCCLDFLDGQYMINILEPKVWASEPVEDPDAPEAFRRSGRISQHIAFLKDWFRSYKDFTDAEVDTIEIMLSQLYKEFGLTEKTDFSKLKPEDYPVLSDLYNLCIQEYHCYDLRRKPLYTEETLRNICLGLNSVCVGSESRFFNGHTNIENNMFLVFGVKGVMDLNKKLRCAILNAVDRISPTGKRDYAILLLVIQTGFRAADIRRLKLKDIDWKNHKIHITTAKNGQEGILRYRPSGL